MTMRILALDLATKTGWAHSDGMSGVWDLSIRRDESSGMRLLRLAGKLRDIKRSVGIDLIVFEAARHARPKRQGALVVHAELQGVIKHRCELWRIDYRGYSPSEIKKHAIGKGIASKEKMLEAAEKRWPEKEITGHDEADALWLLDLVQSDLGEQ